MSTNNPSGRDIRPPRRQLAAIPDVDDHEHPRMSLSHLEFFLPLALLFQ